jgi:hypothetical protein
MRTRDAKKRIFFADILPPNIDLARLELGKKLLNKEISLFKN